MKYILTLFSALSITIGVNAQGIDFKDYTFEKALEQAKEQNKLIFIDAYTVWCGPCKLMSKEVFPQKEVGDYMNQNFISLKIDMEKGEGLKLAKTYDVKAFPTLLFLDNTGKVIHTKVGAANVSGFISEAQIAKEPSKQLPFLTKKYNDGNRDIAFISQYVQSLCSARMNDEEAKVGKLFISQMPIEKSISEDGFAIIKHVGIDYKSPIYNYYIKNSEKIKALEKIGKQGYDQVVGGVVRDYVVGMSKKAKSLEEFNIAIAETKKDFIFDQQEFMENSWRNQYFIANEKYDLWLNNVDDQVSELEKNNKKNAATTYINTSYSIAMNPSYKCNKFLYERAIAMAEKALKIDETSNAANFCLATLYKNQGNKEAALRKIDIYIENSKQAVDSRVLALKKEIENIQ